MEIESNQLIDIPMINQDCISVGFANITAIKPLKEFLEALIGKNTDKILDESDKRENKRENKREQLNSKRQAENKKVLEELKEKIGEGNKSIEDLLTTEENLESRRRQFDAKLFTVLKGISEGVLKQFSAADKVAKTFIDLEKNGVFLSGGVNSLGKAAADLGMTYEGLSNQLKKTSPLIAKMNANMGDGLEIFKNTIQSIDDKYNLSRDEQVSVFEAVMDKLSPTQLKEMSQEQLAKEVNETAKQMKLLSIATGKSVENLKQEQEIKNQQKRVQAYARTHKESYSLLKTLGFDDEMIDYIASGGVRTNGKILMQQMNSPAMQKMLPEIMRMANTNRLTTESLGSLINQNRQFIGAKTNYANRMAFNQGSYGAASVSDMYQYAAYDNSFDEMMANFNPNASNLYNNRTADNNMISNVYGADRAHNRYDTEVLRLTSGGRDGINAVANIRKGVYGPLGAGLGATNNFLEDKNVAGFTTGVAASSLTAAIPHLKNWLYSKASDVLRPASDVLFAFSVNKFAKSVGLNGSILSTFKAFIRHPIKSTRIAFKKTIKAIKSIGIPITFIKNKFMSLKDILGKFTKTISNGTLSMINFFKNLTAAQIGKGFVRTGLAGIGVYGMNESIFSDQKNKGALKSAALGAISALAIFGAAVNWNLAALKWAPLAMALGGTVAFGKNLFDNWDSNKGIWENIKAAYSWDRNEEKTSVTSIKPYTSGSITTPQSSSSYEFKSYEYLKEIRDYTRQEITQNQCLIDAAGESNRINQTKIYYDKTKSEDNTKFY